MSEEEAEMRSGERENGRTGEESPSPVLPLSPSPVPPSPSALSHESRLTALEAEVRRLRGELREQQSPLRRVGVFLAVEETAADGTFHEVVPSSATEITALTEGRIVSSAGDAALLLRDPVDADDNPVVGVLGFTNGTNAAYVKIGGAGADYYQDEVFVMSSPAIIRISRDNNTDDILEFFEDTMDDMRPCLSLRFKDPPSGYPVLQGNGGNVVWDGVRLDNV